MQHHHTFAGLWQHALDVRYKLRGRLRTHLGLVAALATGKVTVKAVRKGMRIGAVLSEPESFLRAHRESEARVSAALEAA